jgi:hypothetical protein
MVLLHGCGGASRDADEPADQPADAPTVLDPLIAAPGRVQQGLDASREGHEQALERAIEASEDAPAPSAADGE